ncbi:MAG: methyl-accepting chemotaxis protein [Parachlamydia sp.]|nr:methyl-accepting chemotaxis protein [Parachlamydia sp.]
MTSFVRRFIRSFSYKNKLRFVLLSSYVPAFVLLAAVPLLLNGPIRDLRCKQKAMGKLDEAASAYLQGLPEIAAVPTEKFNREKPISEIFFSRPASTTPTGLPASVVKKISTDLDLSERIFSAGIAAEIVEAEKQMDALRQDPALVCAFSLLQRDNGGRRLLQAVDWEMPESRSALAGLISTIMSANQEKPSFTTLTQLELNRQKLLQSSKRAVTELELAYRSNGELIPLTREMQAWKEQVGAFAALFDNASSRDSMADLAPSGIALLKNTLELQKKLYAQSEKNLEIQIHTLARARLISLLTLISGAVLVALLYLSENIRRPLAGLKKALQELSRGSPVRMPLTAQNEMRPVCSAYNQLADYVEDFWKDISRIKKHMNDTFEQISLTTRQLDDTIESEVVKTKQIAKGSREIRVNVQSLTEELISASRSAVATGALAATGDEGLHHMEAVMQELLNASSTIVSTLSVLQQEVSTVNKVILAIVKIADQSNLLSLNTAIRASKSGAEGRGFAVIADRIREMADQIAHVTLDIEKSVQEIILTVLEAVERVTAFSEEIRSHVQDTGEVSAKLKQLISATQDQVMRFERIKEEMQSQLQQISQITEITSDIKKGATASHQLAGRLRSEVHHADVIETRLAP